MHQTARRAGEVRCQLVWVWVWVVFPIVLLIALTGASPPMRYVAYLGGAIGLMFLGDRLL